LLVAAVHLVVSWLPDAPGARMLGDHYSLGSDFRLWLLLSVLGFAAASLGGRLAGQAQPRTPDRAEQALPRR
jgi:hypothetical protein